MRGRRKALRNLALFGCAVLFMAALIAMAAQARKPVRILPPESPEIVAQRQAPENGYFTLLEAAKLLSMKPPPLIVPDPEYPTLQSLYRPKEGSLGMGLGIERPDDDPELLKYIEQAAPAAAKAREALQKPYCLEPVSWAEYEEFARLFRPSPQFEPLAQLAAVVLAGAEQTLRSGGSAQEAFSFFRDSVHLTQIVRGDARFAFSHEGWPLRWFCGRISAFPDPILLEVRDLVREARAGVGDRALASLEFQWRQLDAVRRFPLPQGGGSPSAVNSLLMGMSLKRFRTTAAKNKDALRAAALLPYGEFDRWREAHRELSIGGNSVPSPAGIVGWFVSSRVDLETRCVGVETAIALELYRRANAKYPESLEALTPQFLPAPPQDLFRESGASFIYRLQDDDYLLYSLGEDGRDQGGDSRRGDIVIHGKSE